MLVSLFTDASWCPYTKAAGWAIWAKCHSRTIKYSGPIKGGCEEAEIAEACAIANGMILVTKHFENAQVVLIQTDCLNVIKNYPQARPTHSSIQPALNNILATAQKHELVLKWRHIKAHTNIKTPRNWVNNWCDENAKLHMREQRKQFQEN